MSSRKRVPAGVPAGGQFAAHAHGEPAVCLPAQRSVDGDYECPLDGRIGALRTDIVTSRADLFDLDDFEDVDEIPDRQDALLMKQERLIELLEQKLTLVEIQRRNEMHIRDGSETITAMLSDGIHPVRTLTPANF